MTSSYQYTSEHNDQRRAHLYSVSSAAKKRNTLDTNNTYNVNAALSKSIYVHRTLIVEWGQLSVAERYWAKGDIRHIITENHIHSANEH
jgi:hypothetical protein